MSAAVTIPFLLLPPGPEPLGEVTICPVFDGAAPGPSAFEPTEPTVGLIGRNTIVEWIF